jgi:branched-chain amino acid transport system ATP-binding protein
MFVTGVQTCALPIWIEEALELFPELRDRLLQQAGSLSGGEQQMVALARTLILRPSLLLLDEPSLGLSPGAVDSIFARVTEMRDQAKCTIVIVEQKVNLVLDVCDRVCCMKLGRVVFSGVPSDLQGNEARLKELFL